LAKRGLRQFLVYSPAGADSGLRAALDSLRDADVDVRECHIPHAVGFGDIAAVLRLRAILRATGPDVIHLHSSKAGAVGRLAVMAGMRQPVIYTPHATGAHLGWTYALAEWVLGRTRTDLCIAVSQSEGRDLRRFRVVPESRIREVVNGIDAEAVREFARGLNPPPASVDVTVCARVTSQKDPLAAAKASAHVLQVRPKTRFRWVGDGDMRDRFEAALRGLGIRSSWDITGWVENPYGYMMASRLLWLPSRYESFGYVTLEGMALGVPTIGTKVAGTMDLIMHGDSGYLVDPGDVQRLAAHTVECLDDRALLGRLSAGARARAEAMTVDKMVTGTLAAYAATSAADGVSVR